MANALRVGDHILDRMAARNSGAVAIKSELAAGASV
jgi:hypothetical protein